MRIGLLIGTYNSGYSLAMIRWMRKELEGRKHSLVVFEGYSLLNNTISDYQCNAIYRLISNERIDGLIIVSSSLAIQSGRDVLQDFAVRIGLPAVSLGIELEGVPSVVMDNSAGFDMVVSHLISHGYKKFAHISGPLNNPESMLRRDSLMKVVYRNGLDIPGSFILEGNFGYSSGYNHARKLITFVKNKEIDAIVAANDQMAFGIAKCLTENGLRIPEDVAVTGFDDAGVSLFPITTVSQPFNEMCRKAVSLVIDLKYGKKDTSLYTYEPHLKIRRSCGCNEPAMPAGEYNAPVYTEYKINGRLQSLDIEGFSSALSDYLSENGILNCFIARFMDTVRFDDFAAARQNPRCKLFYGYSNGKRIFNTKPFEASSILPDLILDDIEETLLIKPLSFGKVQFGYLVISASESASAFIEDLGVEMGNCLENIYLMQERQVADKKLSDTLESLILTNRKLNEIAVKENLDKLNHIRHLASHMMQNRKASTGDYYLIIAEIDNFIEVNNQYGFDEGENLINNVSKILAGSIRDDDYLSHQSCERYVILVKNAQSNAIEAIEKRFRDRIGDINSKLKSPYPISFSWGCAYAKYDSDFDKVFSEAENDLANKKSAK